PPGCGPAHAQEALSRVWPATPLRRRSHKGADRATRAAPATPASAVPPSCAPASYPHYQVKRTRTAAVLLDATSKIVETAPARELGSSAMIAYTEQSGKMVVHEGHHAPDPVVVCLQPRVG